MKYRYGVMVLASLTACVYAPLFDTTTPPYVAPTQDMSVGMDMPADLGAPIKPDATNDMPGEVSLAAPQNLRVTSEDGGVLIEWSPVIDATGYEVQITESGPWLKVGDQTSYLDSTAPEWGIASGRVEATDGASREHVSLSLADVVRTKPSSVEYRVRATFGDVRSPSSAPIDGVRLERRISCQWQRSRTSQPDAFEDMEGALGETWEDGAAPEMAKAVTIDAIPSAKEM